MPDPFASLRRMADTSDLPSLDEEEIGRRAKALTDALEGIPDVHAAMREARQEMAFELQRRKVSHRRIAAMIDRSPTRVVQILKGETARKRPEREDAGVDPE
ncbi:hypothetical protein [Plantactinospora sp. WMMB782]|uniref:hypothetical protein n=1 Tax=Plantactinospora sp. WMMB782 TaxID=3404121 RepID=UPI003B92E50A